MNEGHYLQQAALRRNTVKAKIMIRRNVRPDLLNTAHSTTVIPTLKNTNIGAYHSGKELVLVIKY